MITPDSSLADVAGEVAASLREIGYDPIVVGGSACTLNAPNAYRSVDIDMVILGGIQKSSEVVHCMAALGFRLAGGTFVHDRSPYTVDFVPSPVAIGDFVISNFETIATTGGPVRALRPADAVCDRFNKFVVWHDYDALAVAVSVARACDIDIGEVEAFVNRHAGGLASDRYVLGYRTFLDRLSEG